MSEQLPQSSQIESQISVNPSLMRYVRSQIVQAEHEVAQLEHPRTKGVMGLIKPREMAKIRLANVQPLPEQLAKGEYQGLAAVLQTDVTRIEADMAFYQKKLQGKLEGDDGPDGYLALKQRRLHGERIAAKLTDHDDKAWVVQVDAELKTKQEHTERGSTMTRLNWTDQKRAYLKQLQQLLPQPAND